MNEISKPKPSAEEEAATQAEIPLPPTTDPLIALFREISADVKARGLSMTQEEIDEEMALYKAERRG